MRIDDKERSDSTRPSARLDRMRRLGGIAVTFLGGPAAMAFAVTGLGMGPIEATAVLILLSGWLGPRLMRTALA